MPQRGVSLEAATDARALGAGWEATGPEPWLKIDAPPSAGRWVRIVYASGLTDPLTRPVLRCIGRLGAHDELMPAAMLGRAVWIGRLPEDITEILISPTLAQGPFAFRVERWDVLSVVQAMAYFNDHRLGRAAKYAWGRLRGLESFARLQARRALGATRLEDYETLAPAAPACVRAGI